MQRMQRSYPLLTVTDPTLAHPSRHRSERIVAPPDVSAILTIRYIRFSERVNARPDVSTLRGPPRGARNAAAATALCSRE